MTSGFTSFRQLQRFPETPVSRLEEQQFQHSNSRKAPCPANHLKMRADSLASTEEVWQLSTSTSSGFSLSNSYVRGPLVCCLKWKGHRDALTLKKAGFPCSSLNKGSSFISQDEGMSESLLETLEKELDPHHIWKGDLTSL